jgi:hypothetical protein
MLDKEVTRQHMNGNAISGSSHLTHRKNISNYFNFSKMILQDSLTALYSDFCSIFYG